MVTAPPGENDGDQENATKPALAAAARGLPRIEGGWYRSPWLLPVVGLAAIALADQIAGATWVVRAAVIAVALCVAVIGASSFEEPRYTAMFVAGVLVFAASALVVLDRPSVHDALEPTTTPAAHSPRRHVTTPRSLSGMTVRADQIRAHDLRGIDFTAATLDGLEMRDRVLSGDHFEGASLAGVDLRRAELQGAHLEGALLRGARLDDACLLGAHLDGADVSGATFAGADVIGVTSARVARRSAASWPGRGASGAACP